MISAIAGSFQLVIVLAKMPASTSGVRFRLSTTGQVVRDRDRRDVVGRFTAPDRRRTGRSTGRTPRPSRYASEPAKPVPPDEELLPSTTGTDRVVLDGYVGVQPPGTRPASPAWPRPATTHRRRRACRRQPRRRSSVGGVSRSTASARLGSFVGTAVRRSSSLPHATATSETAMAPAKMRRLLFTLSDSLSECDWGCRTGPPDRLDPADGSEQVGIAR